MYKPQSPYCIVCGDNKWGVTYYNFPKCPEQRAKWYENLNISADQKVTSRSRVCQRHFRKELCRVHLKRGTLPLKLGPEGWKPPPVATQQTTTATVKTGATSSLPQVAVL